MMPYLEAFLNTFNGSLYWTWKSIIGEVPWFQNYFWGIIIISLLVWGLEIVFPWRKHQAIIRKDFWLDVFYMFFNFFVFSIAVSGFYALLTVFFNDLNIPLTQLVLIDLADLPQWAQLLLFFVVLDFVQWLTHMLLHKYSFLWQFHKVHHSVKEMGFAAHMRYHWMENILYKPLKTFAVMILGGFEPQQAFVVHFMTIMIGHLNHANIKLTWGIFKYLFNNPVMHLYHHAKTIPTGKVGVNFAISLSLWDYLFKTNYIPEDSGEAPLGFPEDETFPKSFVKQQLHGFKKE
ncbi:MAG: sterol desaturase family protein [Flammeovirgaceae bacterium]|jgi:sterol desaturase/sphingolipid hydroxylase (fatty acid hydroxylase superfamily)|nr:sterol desaturase family protein [Flammeovirgaceae bacterium]